MIHKRFMRLSIAVLFGISLLMSCASTGGNRSKEPVYEPLHGTVSSVDKYGNLTTDITETALQEKGYELGDVLLAQLGDKIITAPFVATYSDVNRGDYLIRISHGFTAIAMSYDNCSGKTGAVGGNPKNVKIMLPMRCLPTFALFKQAPSLPIGYTEAAIRYSAMPAPRMRQSSSKKLKSRLLSIWQIAPKAWLRILLTRPTMSGW